MKKMTILLMCVLMLLAAPLALADDTEITSRGTAEIAAEPDMFTVTSSVSTTEISLARAQESVAGVIADVTAKLVELGVPQEDIVTQDFSYYQEYDYSSGEAEPRMIGYRVYHSLCVTCRDLDMMDSVLAVLADSGMTETWNIGFDISNRSELYRQALTLAIGAAKEKAEVMAAAQGLTITGVDSITEVSSGDVAYYANTAETVSMDVAASKGDGGVRSGSVGVSASVTLVCDAK